MKFFRLDLLTLLISLFILGSCKNEGAVGPGVIPGTVSGALVDSSTIVVNTFTEDSVGTTDLAKNPLAYFIDPTFGITETAIATDLNLPGSLAYTRPTGTITIDSARLILRFADGFYGDSIESKYTVNVYQLQQQLSGTTSYYNTTNLGDYTSQPLIGSLTFNARTHNNIKIYNIITGAPDTLVSVSPQIRVPISNDFINNYFFNASGTTLASNVIFQSLVKGLYIKLDKTKTTGEGGIIMLKDSSQIAIYYKQNTGSAIDTSSVVLPITRTATQIAHTYPAAIQTELRDTATSRNLFYLQGLAGLRARVKFPNLLLNLRAALLKNNMDLVINRAELVVTPLANFKNPYLPIIPSPLPQITMYRLDIAHQRTYIEDGSPLDGRSQGSAVFGGFYTPSKRNYHFILTAYCQDLLLGKTVDYGTFIAPVDAGTSTQITSSAYLPTAQASARTVAVGTVASLSDSTYKYQMKLNIIYTKVKKAL